MRRIASSCYYCSSLYFVVVNRNGSDMATLVATVITGGVAVVDASGNDREKWWW